MTTSANHTQLEAVLWGEIRRFIQESVVSLVWDPPHGKYGPLLVNHMNIRRVYTGGPNKGELCPLSYLKGVVSAKGEGMLGHHLPRGKHNAPHTLWLADEASGVDDTSYERSQTWSHRSLVIGNPYPGAPGCTFFEKYCEQGDVKATA